MAEPAAITFPVPSRVIVTTCPTTPTEKPPVISVEEAIDTPDTSKLGDPPGKVMIIFPSEGIPLPPAPPPADVSNSTVYKVDDPALLFNNVTSILVSVPASASFGGIKMIVSKKNGRKNGKIFKR